MGNFIYAVIILVLIFSFTIVNSFIVCSICDSITDLIDEGQTESACNKWNSNRKYISLFIKDTEIDLVDTAIRQIESGTEGGLEFFREAVDEVRRNENACWDCIF